MNARRAIIASLLAAMSLAGCTSQPSESTTRQNLGASTVIDGPTVGYVRITWRQDVDVRCTTPETFDNGGADSAVIEVWGPTQAGRWRADMIAPNGETEVVIADVVEDGTVLQSWGTYHWANPMPTGSPFEEVTAFRHVECVTSTPTSRESLSVSDGPYSPGRLPFPQLIPVGDRRIDVVEVLPDIATDRRTDEWMGAEYDVFISASEPPPDQTGQSQETEFWLNRETELIDRVVNSNRSTQTGSEEAWSSSLNAEHARSTR